jgi:hypothetical protein
VKRIAVVLVGLLTALPGCGVAMPPVKDGDIIFQTSMSTQSAAIQEATHSRYSHMGVIISRGGSPFVFEASAKVQYTPLRDWIARGRDGAYVLKRLATGLTTAQAEKLRVAARAFEGRPYDLTFEWSDERIYCSELVWKLYDRALGIHIGELQRLRTFDLSGTAVRAKMLQRYKGNVPLDELVISPVAMFGSKGLIDASRKGT